MYFPRSHLLTSICIHTQTEINQKIFSCFLEFKRVDSSRVQIGTLQVVFSGKTINCAHKSIKKKITSKELIHSTEVIKYINFNSDFDHIAFLLFI